MIYLLGYRICFILLLVTATSTIAQPIYAIQHEGVEVGILAGGVHRKFIKFPPSVSINIQKQIDKASALYMEFNDPSAPIPKILKEYGSVPSNNMRALIQAERPPCLMEIAPKEYSQISGRSYLMDIPPQLFFVLGVAPFSKPINPNRIDPKAESIDGEYKLRAVKKNIEIYEIEGWRSGTELLMAVDGKIFFDAAESLCNLFYKTDHFKKNLLPVDSDIFLNAIEAGDSDKIAEYTISAFIDTGWPAIGVDITFNQRNIRFGKKINQILNEKISEKPIFVIGSAHLGGQHGIINQLEKLGYKIVAIQ